MQARATRLLLNFLPAVFALAALLVILFIAKADPLEVLETFQKGAFRNERRLAGVVEFSIPLILVSMGLVITFTTGLWNIGVEGQMIIGALFASGVAFSVPIEDNTVLLILEVIAAMIGGALWGLLIGVLKMRLGVNEIFSGVALNSIASLIALQLISGPWKPPSDNADFSRNFPEAALFPAISREFKVSLFAIVLTLIAVLLVILILRGTRWGLYLKAAGKNPRSALLLGVPTIGASIGALMFCGALAGIGGAHRVLFTLGRVETNFSGGIGFMGLLVVLLVSIRAVWVPLVAFLFAAMLKGGTQLQLIGLSSAMTGVLQGVMVLAVILSYGVRDRLIDRWFPSAEREVIEIGSKSSGQQIPSSMRGEA